MQVKQYMSYGRVEGPGEVTVPSLPCPHGCGRMLAIRVQAWWENGEPHVGIAEITHLPAATTPIDGDE